MPNPFRILAGLPRAARLGLLAAGGVAAGAVVATTAGPGSAPPAPVPATGALGASETGELGDAALQQGPTPIELEVDPEVVEWPDEGSVEITGTTAIDAENPHVTLTVVSPSGKRYELERAAVGPDGSFEATFDLHADGRLELGRFEVSAVSPGGFGSAEAGFAVQHFEEIEHREWQAPAERLTQRGFDLVANLKTCLGNMPVSPARENLRARVNELERALQERLSGTPSLPALYAAVVAELEDLPDEAISLEPLLEPLGDRLDEWGKEAEQLEHRIRHEGRRCLGAASCDRADLIAQDLDLLDDLMVLLRRPVDLIAGYRNSADLQEALRKVTMVDLNFLELKLNQAQARLEAGGGGLNGWFAGARTRIRQTRELAQRELFQPYCRKFEGPVSLRMQARAWSTTGEDWWKFEVALEGRLTLRYPQAAGGRSVPLTGELTGCATRFKSWDNALRVGWPKLTAGALLFRTVQEPYEGTCPRFEVPVKGELRGEEIVLTLEDAAREDYGEPTAKVRYVVISPLAGGLPANTSFELPYKSAHFIWNRALEGKPLTLPIQRVGNRMVVETALRASRGGERIIGEYEGSLKACNPGCSTAGGDGGDESPDL